MEACSWLLLRAALPASARAGGVSRVLAPRLPCLTSWRIGCRWDPQRAKSMLSQAEQCSAGAENHAGSPARAALLPVLVQDSPAPRHGDRQPSRGPALQWSLELLPTEYSSKRLALGAGIALMALMWVFACLQLGRRFNALPGWLLWPYALLSRWIRFIVRVLPKRRWPKNHMLTWHSPQLCVIYFFHLICSVDIINFSLYFLRGTGNFCEGWINTFTRQKCTLQQCLENVRRL